MHNPQPLEAIATTLDELTLLTASEAMLYVEGTDAIGRMGRAYEAPGGVAMTINWATRTLMATTTIQEPSGASGLVLHVEALIPNLPPTADAGPDQQLECDSGALVATVSSSASSDPDGTADIVSHVWTSDLGDAVRTMNGPTWTAPIHPSGTTYFTVMVGDEQGLADTDTVAVSVEDSQPPVLAIDHVAADCLWPPNHDMVLFELGDEVQGSAFDACDDTPLVRIVSVTSNEPDDGIGDGSTSPDVVFGTGAFCIRAERSGTNQAGRTYTVTLEAEDAAGLVDQSSFTVRVPHHAGPGGCAEEHGLEVVQADDPRCTAAAPMPSPAPDSVGEAPGPPPPHGDETSSPDEAPSCALRSSSSRSESSPWWVLALGVLAARRSPMIRRWRGAVLALLAVGAVGCGDSSGSQPTGSTGSQGTGGAPPEEGAGGYAETPEEIQACMIGGWYQDGFMACQCSDSALDTPECGEADCIIGGGMAFHEDGRYLNFQMTRSASAGTASVIGSLAGASPGTWSISDDGLYEWSTSGNMGADEVKCSPTEFVRVGKAAFNRAPSALSDGLVACMDSDIADFEGCFSIPYQP